jgi:NADH:ubiquinone oxidoreductase subunit
MGILKNAFTWWEGATFGTWMGLRGKTRVGEDSLGNVYWEGGSDASGLVRRWVIYSGPNDASRVPAEWFSWLHHQIADAPEDSLPPPRIWEKPSEANLTGTRQAYRPSGSLDAGGRRAAATGDYEAWAPDA